MKIKLIVTFILFTVVLSAQDQFIKLNKDLKRFSYEDMVRVFGENYQSGRVFKTAGDPREIREVIVRGNSITTVLFNYGSITKPNYLGNRADLVWRNLGYGFEFGPLAAAEVLNPKAGGGFDTLRITSDSFVLVSQGDYSPDGTLKWGWLPKPGYADPNSNEIARLNAPDNNGDGKPDSWPERWYSPGAGRYVWPAFLGDQATAPDEEVYFVVDDYTNQEFNYYPFPSDSTKRGIGLDMEVRNLQFNNPLAKDIFFLVYQVTNASEKDITKIFFGMQGDPHVGGPADYADDRAYFIPATGPLADPYVQRARNMVYAWDDDMKGDGGLFAGYFGWKFLESPTSSADGIDNDDDGIIDDTPFNPKGTFIDGVLVPLNTGIADVAKYTAIYGAPRPRWSGDEDGDWDIAKDDIGIDGIGPESQNYPGPDYGEGDGVPSQAYYSDLNLNGKYDVGEPLSDIQLDGYFWAGSEPNFGLRDITESDQIGLSSFTAESYGTTFPRDDAKMWEWLSKGTIDPNQELLNEQGDNIFNFGTGPLHLHRGETQRFSMAILFGNNLNDLVLNAETSTRVLESDYRFAKPPEKPIVKAVAGDKKVTLYWNTESENSFDPFLRAFDFQGYKIYRSRDYTFSDVLTITDGNGVPFLGQALFDPNSGKNAQFDKKDSLSGFHPVEYSGRGVKYYLGDNTGLVHQYIDSTVQNGVRYFYAVVAYDGGSILFNIPPTETQAVIDRDPITGNFKFDVNTVEVTPNGLASGIVGAEAGIGGLLTPLAGTVSTGKVSATVLEDLKVQDKLFFLNFHDASTYSILDSTGTSESFFSKDTVFVNLQNTRIEEGSFVLTDAAGNVVSASKYVLNAEEGKIRSAAFGDLPLNQKFTAAYRYYPVYRSKNVNGEDGNHTFDGVRVFVKNDTLTLNQSKTKFNNNDINLRTTVTHMPVTVGNPTLRVKYRADWEIRWNNLDTVMQVTGVDTTYRWVNVGDSARSATGALRVLAPFTIWNVTDNLPATYIVRDANDKNRGRWNWGETIILQPQGETGLRTSYEIIIREPADSISPKVFPKSGDVFTVFNDKPFVAGDRYILQTKKASFSTSSAQGGLENVFVVPNPYVGFSTLEEPGNSPTARGDRKVEFRNLPQRATVRIYTLAGELVQTIEKDDMTNYAVWDLLSYEGQRTAYGIYIYHVDAPGVGEKIGRLALIK